MKVPVSEAKTHLTELVRRAEAGEEVVLTRHGVPVVRLMPLATRLTVEERRALLDAVGNTASAKAGPGPTASESQDFLYDDAGLPR